MCLVHNNYTLFPGIKGKSMHILLVSCVIQSECSMVNVDDTSLRNVLAYRSIWQDCLHAHFNHLHKILPYPLPDMCGKMSCMFW